MKKVQVIPRPHLPLLSSELRFPRNPDRTEPLPEPRPRCRWWICPCRGTRRPSTDMSTVLGPLAGHSLVQPRICFGGLSG